MVYMGNNKLNQKKKVVNVLVSSFLFLIPVLCAYENYSS